MSDKKHNKLIIPKIKTTTSSTSPNKQNQKTTPELKPKVQNQLIKPMQFTPSSNRKTFPKQEDLEKMPKLQLAQTYYDQLMHLRKENEVLQRQLGFVRQQRDQLYKRYNELKVKYFVTIRNNKRTAKISDQSVSEESQQILNETTAALQVAATKVTVHKAPQSSIQSSNIQSSITLKNITPISTEKRKSTDDNESIIAWDSNKVSEKVFLSE